MPDRSPARILLGRISGAHGIRGDVVLRSFTEAPEDIAAYGPLSDAEGTRTFKLQVVRLTPKAALIARVEGVNDRNGAEALAGKELYIERQRLPEAGAAEYYHADLIGLAAVDEDGRHVGEVVAVLNYGAGDLIEVQLSGTRRTEMLPFTDAFVPEVDIEARRIVVKMPTEEDGVTDA